MVAPMNPINQHILDLTQERDDALAELQQAREARPGWRLVRWARAGNHNLLGIIVVVVAALGVVGWVFHEKGPKVGIVALLLGFTAVAIFMVVSWLADRHNHEGQT